jgi:hypothetical protein
MSGRKSLSLAEKEGFEPSVREDPYAGFRILHAHRAQ